MSLLKRLMSSAHYSGIEYALALQTRNEVRRDGLTLMKTSNQLVVEWRARDIHPWDCDEGHSFEEKECLFCEQCFSDADAAIRRLFASLPTIDEIQFRVMRPGTGDELLSGRVTRSSLRQVDAGASPRGRLWQMGVNVCVSGMLTYTH
jgi:hypothetical protein